MDERAEERRIISARLSAEAAAGWREFCRANGVSLTAFMEVAGRDLAEDSAPSSVKARQEMVEAAREIDMRRRERRT